MIVFCFFFFKQKTAYEMRISDWSSDVCSSDLAAGEARGRARRPRHRRARGARLQLIDKLGGIGDRSSSSDPASRRSSCERNLEGPEPAAPALFRSEERRVGKECGSTC